MNLGDVTISDRQLEVHKRTEFIGAYVGTPFFVWLAFNKKLPGWARATAVLFAIGSVWVDGGLLQTWKAKERGEKGLWG